MELAYQRCVWDLVDDFDQRGSFDKALRRLDMTSSPGIPYLREATTNGKWLKWNGLEVCSIQADRLWYDVQQVLQGNWETELRVFIKQEPHKLKKVQEGRWRLILASPLCVQVAWQMMFSEAYDKDIDNAYYIPSQQGAVFVGGGWKLFTQMWAQQGLTCGLDKEAWDWTAPAWVFDVCLQLTGRLMRGSRREDWQRIAKSLHKDMFEDPILVLGSGMRYKQLYPGIMKSGCVGTININSRSQVAVHLIASYMMGVDPRPLPACCGDDTIQHVRHTSYLEVYERLGVRIKSVSDTLEFMGHDFPTSGPRPLYLMKHLKKAAYVREEDLGDYLDSMARMYVHTDLFWFWEKLATVLHRRLPLSRESYLYWYDNSD